MPQSLVASLLLSPGSWCAQGSVCALQESISRVLCKFWQLYVGVNGDLLQEGLCHSQVCCTQPYPSLLHPEPMPLQSPLLICISTGDTQAQFCLSLCGVSGSWCTRGLFEPSEHLWWVWGFDSKCDFHHFYHLAGVFLPLDVRYLLIVIPAPCSCSSSAMHPLVQPPVECYKLPSIVLQALCLPDLIR